MSATYAETWRDDALCRQIDSAIFFPPKGESTKQAKRICGLCEVRAECLAEALSRRPKDDYGIWGGLSEGERKRLRRQGQRPATVTPLPFPAVATDAPRRAAA
jgi:hypothetical protein